MPFSTMFGGTCCRPRALRSRDSTTTILVKDVTITATKGASASRMTVTSAEPGENWDRSMSDGLLRVGDGVDQHGVGLAQGHQTAAREGLAGAAQGDAHLGVQPGQG